MKKALACLLVMSLLFCLIGCQKTEQQAPEAKEQQTVAEHEVQQPAAEPEKEENTEIRLDFIAASDFAGSIEASDYYAGSAKYAAYINYYRDQNPEGTFLMDCGDALVGTPVSNLQNGEPVIEVMNVMGYDVMNIGNHEFDWGMAVSGKTLEKADFPLICANVVYSANQEYLRIAKPYVILEKQGVKVGVLGLLTKETPAITRRTSVEGYDFLDPIETAKKLIPQMREEGAEIIVCLTHLPAYLQEDGSFQGEVIDFVNAVEGADVVIAGHYFDPMAMKIGETPVFQSTHNGSGFGHISIVYDKAAKKIVSSDVELVDVLNGTLDVQPDAEIEKIVDKYVANLGGVFEEVIGQASEELTIGYVDEFAIGDWWTDAICHATGAQISFLNSSGIFETIPAGDITLGKIYTVSPFENNLVIASMTGSQLKELFEISYDSTRIQEYGALQISGMIVTYDLNREDYDKVVSMTLSDGTPIEDDGVYQVATLDFLATGGNGYENLLACTWDQTGILSRDAYVEELRNLGSISNAVYGRLNEVK